MSLLLEVEDNRLGYPALHGYFLPFFLRMDALYALSSRELYATGLCTFNLVNSGGLAIEVLVGVQLGLLWVRDTNRCHSLNGLHNLG